MNDHPPRNEAEAEARRLLVSVARSMLAGKLSFMEGANQVLRLKDQLGGVRDGDDDFDCFVLIASETDHLPLEAQRPLWTVNALKRLAP
jgi:hypothetical protein